MPVPDVINGFPSTSAGWFYGAWAPGWTSRDPLTAKYSGADDGPVVRPVDIAYYWIEDPPGSGEYRDNVEQGDPGVEMNMANGPLQNHVVYRARLSPTGAFDYFVPFSRPDVTCVNINPFYYETLGLNTHTNRTSVLNIWVEDPATGSVISGSVQEISVDSSNCVDSVTPWGGGKAGLSVDHDSANSGLLDISATRFVATFVLDGVWDQSDLDLVFGLDSTNTFYGANRFVRLWIEPFLRLEKFEAPPDFNQPGCRPELVNTFTEVPVRPVENSIEATPFVPPGPDQYHSSSEIGGLPLVPATGASTTPVTVPFTAANPMWRIQLGDLPADKVGFLEMEWSVSNPFGADAFEFLYFSAHDPAGRFYPCMATYHETYRNIEELSGTNLNELTRLPAFANPWGLPRYPTEDPYGGFSQVFAWDSTVGDQTFRSIWVVPSLAADDTRQAMTPGPVSVEFNCLIDPTPWGLEVTLESLTWTVCSELILRQYPRDDDLGIGLNNKSRVWVPASGSHPSSRQRSQRESRYGTYL